MATDERGPKEQAYDAEIAPLMTTIIAVCKRTGIPVMATFQLDGDLACTTYIYPEQEAAIPVEDRPFVKVMRTICDEAVQKLRAAPSVVLAMVIRRPG